MKLRICMLALLFLCLIGAGISLAEAVTIRPGDLIIADANRFIADAPRLITPGAVIKIDPVSGEQEVISEGEYLITPIGIALHPDGGIIVADRDLPGIVRIEPLPPHAQTVLSQGGLLTDPIGVAVDQVTGEIIVAVPVVGIVGVSLLGQRLISAITGISQFFGVAIEPSGSLAVADLVGRAVLRINPATGAQTLVSSGELLDMGPIGIAVDRDGSLVVGGGMFGNPPIVRVHPATGTQTVISSGQAFVNPYWVAIEADGSIIVSDQEAFGPRDPISGTHQGALFRVHPATGAQILVSAGTNLGDPNGVVIVPGIIPPPAVPVVLVHGICGEPESFGKMAELLGTDAGLAVAAPFDYSALTEGRSDVRIEELASIFAGHVRQVLETSSASQVDVVAHSMGGLIVRAWMAGLTSLPVPYEGQIRKLVLVGTPNYGIRKLFARSRIACSTAQAEQLEFGSKFLWDLHDAWLEFQSESNSSRISTENMLFIAGTQSGASNRWECNGEGCNDGGVEISSAILPDAPNEMVRYVPYRHSRSRILLPSDTQAVAHVNSESHATYLLVRKFLQSGDVVPQCCGPETLDYNPPHLRGEIGEMEGLLLIRLFDTQSGERIQRRQIIMRLDPATRFARQINDGAITAWGVEAGVYAVTICARGYLPVQLAVEIQTARPAIPAPIGMTRGRQLICR